MHNRGDDIHGLNEKRMARYKTANKAHLNLLTIARNKSNNLGVLYLPSNRREDLNSNCGQILQWILKLKSLM